MTAARPSPGPISPPRLRVLRASVRAVSAASAIRSCGYPPTPTALQNRVTVVSLVLAARATSVMLRLATCAGSSSTTLATRCSARARPGSKDRIRTSGLESASRTAIWPDTGSDGAVPITDSVSLTVGKLLTVGICDKATHTLRSDRNPSVSADLDLRLITDQKVANQVGLVNEVKLTTWQLSVAVQTASRRLTGPEVGR